MHLWTTSTCNAACTSLICYFLYHGAITLEWRWFVPKTQGMDQSRSAIPELDKRFGPYMIFDQADGCAVGKWVALHVVSGTLSHNIYIYIIDITTLFQVISVRLLWYVVMIICDAENLEWESSRMNEGNGSGGKNPCKLCKWNRHCLSTHPSLSSQQCKDYDNYMPSQEVERGRAESGCISLLALLGKHYDTWQSTIGVWTCEFAYWWKPSVQMEGIDKR